ncbi:MAG TPA: alpha-lytic protease prodomain-containing protein [Pilimelia sp.]|nr:alpha-lytic protease prodomain-containing protein [Pilimelia sp.]
MSRRPSAIAVAGLTSMSVLAALTVPTGAVAGPAEPAVAPAPAVAAPQVVAPDAASPEMFAALQRDLRLTADQVRARLGQEDRASRVETSLRAQLGASYAGAWLTADASTFVVAVTSLRQAGRVRAAGAEPAVVARSARQLDTVKATLDRVASRAPEGVAGWHVDVRSNSVVVVAAPGALAAARKFVAASGTDAAAVRVVAGTERPRPLYDVRGGTAYYINNSSRCSIGFSVNGGFVTAGHCGRAGATTAGYNRVAQGTVRASSFPGNDYGWVQVNANWTPRPWVNQNGGNVTVTGSRESAVGASICRSGSTTGWHCGTVLAKNSTVNYPQGTVTGLTRTNVCAEPGDSGGSWLSGSQAQGVTSGGSGNCTSGGIIYFQPVNEILSVYGLTLVTSGSPTPPPPPPPPGPPPPPPPGGSAWQPYTPYAVGARVTYSGAGYQCIQAHTSLPGWEPPATPALWQRL